MNNFDYKSLTKEELGYIFDDIDFFIEPMFHQLVSLAFASERNRVSYFHGIGTGKTLCALLTARIWGCNNILVICPSSAFGAWKQDIEQHTDFSHSFVVGNRQNREQTINDGKQVHIINYEGLKSVYADFKSGEDAGGYGGWFINQKKFVRKFDCIIFDEVHKCSNYKSLQSNICFELSNRVGHVIGLTGTPIDKSMLELFNIYRVIDLGRSLGHNFFAYRNKHFRKYGPWDWVPKTGEKEKILNRLSDTTISFDRSDCFDLPEIQVIERLVEPTQDFHGLQGRIINGETISFGEVELETDKVEVKAVLLRELAGGFLYFKEKENKRSHVLKDNPKIEALVDIIEDTGSKIIVYYQFIEELKMIGQELKKHKINFVSADGDQDQKDRQKSINKFTGNKKVKVMLAHPRCASEGFDGSAANVVIFFDPIASPKTRDQCIGRVHRKGQTRNTLVIDLMLNGSIDSTIARNRGKRTTLVQSVMEFIKSYHSGANQ